MTQFILLHADPPISSQWCEIKALSTDDNFLSEAARVIFMDLPPRPTWMVLTPGTDFDGLYCVASSQIQEGRTFEATILYQLLTSLIQPGTAIALWYGDEYIDLPTAKNSELFLREVNASLLHPSVECYALLIEDR